MNIDRDNYEAWLLDRLEGRLTAAQERALDAFLAAHPDLQEQAGTTDLPRINADPEPFGMAAALKRTVPPTGPVTDATIVDHLIARAEGDLDPQQLKALERYLYEHPEQERAARLVAVSRVPRSEEALSGRERLQKHFPPVGDPDRARITDFLIAAHEGDLDAARTEKLRRLVASDAGLQREERLVAAATVRPAADSFPMKERLKKREGRVVPLWSFGGGAVRWAAAASVLLLLGLAWWLLREGPSAGGEFARKQPVTTPVSPAPQQPVPAQRPDDQGSAAPALEAPVQQGPEAHKVERQQRMPAPQRKAPGSRSAAPGENAAPVPNEEPLLVQEPAPQQEQPQRQVPVVVPDVPEAGGQALAAVPTKQTPMGQANDAHTVRELLTAGVRERVLDAPADVRPLDRSDAVALADRGLKGITGGNGGVQVERTAKRDRFKVRLGDGLAFSGSIGR
ncbi:MAG: hypothetical protein JNL05_01195 [Flavobacteriales bacterium]|nr:hypothetical protein [Flavobacteriales bacterium]